jgi:hypothetical protein
MPSRLVFSRAFDLAAGATATSTIEVEGDLSYAQALLLELVVTKAEDDADDNLDVRFQDTTDRVVWNTRGRFEAIVGNATVSATAPETRRLTITQAPIALEATEEGYEPSGSAGGSQPSAGAVINGPFPGKFRDATGWRASWRFQLVKTDTAGDDAEFEGTLRVWAVTGN